MMRSARNTISPDRPSGDGLVPSPDDIVVAVMGVTGAGKTSFIQQFYEHDLNIGHGLQSCTSKVEVVPCRLPNGKKAFLIDTPGFDDTYRSDTEILCELVDWLTQAYQSDVKLAGIVYLHRITDNRIGGSGMRNLKMFRKLCGDRGLGSVVLATTMWENCAAGSGKAREDELVARNDYWKYLLHHGARMFRHDDGRASGMRILDYLIAKASPVTLEIQREMVDRGLKLAETGAGREVQGEIERLRTEHEKEMETIRLEMKEAIQHKDEGLQAELREYRDQMGRKMALAAEQARRLEAGREQLRAEMKEQHAREMQELREEIHRKQLLFEQSQRENQERSGELMKEIQNFREKENRRQITAWAFCSFCGMWWCKDDPKTWGCPARSQSAF